jgi:hypothetical protein
MGLEHRTGDRAPREGAQARRVRSGARRLGAEGLRRESLGLASARVNRVEEEEQLRLFTVGGPTGRYRWFRGLG